MCDTKYNVSAIEMNTIISVSNENIQNSPQKFQNNFI